MSQLETLLQTQDVAVEDLLKVEVSYGRLQLLLKMILDTVKSNAAEMKDMKNAQEDLANDQNNLNNKLNDLQNKQAAAKRDQEAMKSMQEYLKGELSKTMDKAGVKQTAPPPPPPPPSEPERAVSEDDWNALENRTRKLENTVSKLRDEIAALKANVGSAPTHQQPTTAPPVARLPELDDSILDDLMANHERRLKNLEEELQRSIAKLQSLSGRRPSSAFQTSKNVTPKLDGVPGAITSIHVNPAISLVAGGPNGQIRFVLSTPASGGPLKLIPQMDDIVFDPPAVNVAVGSLESQPCTVTVGKEAMVGANFIPVALESQSGNNNNITGSPLAATGLTVLPGSKVTSTAIGKSKTNEPTSTVASAASSSSKKPQQEQPKVGGKSSSGDISKPDDKKTTTIQPNNVTSSTSSAVPGVAVKRVSLSAPLHLGVTGGPVYFNVEPPALGGDIILTPEAPNLEFSPPTVVVPAGSSSSGSFVVKALSTAPPGPTPIVVSARAVGPNYNDLSNSPYNVEGVTVDPAQRPLRATVDKIAESKPGVVNSVTLMPGTSLSAGGDSSNYLSFVVDPQAPSGGLKLTPRAQGLHFTPASVIVPAGHTQSQPFVVRADSSAPPGSALVSVVAAPVNDQTHTIGPIEAVGLTIEGLPSAYHTIGSRPTSAAVPGGADDEQRMLRSGLSDRLRQLMDDHERRIKGLEAQYRAVLDRVQQEREKLASYQPKPTDTSSVNGGDPFLEEALKQINERLDALQQGPDPAALQHQLDTLKNRINSLEDHALNSVQSPTSATAAPAADHRLNQVVREMQNQLASLQSKPDIDPAALRKLADDLRHLTLRVVSLESAPPALLEGNTTPVASGIDEAVIQSRLKGLQDAIDAVRQRTGQLDTDVQKVKGQVMEFNARSELNSTRLGNLEDKSQTQGNQIKSLKDQMEELQKGLERLKDSMEGMDLALRRDEEGIKMLNMRLTTMGGQQQLQEKKDAKKPTGDAPPLSASVMANIEDLRNMIGQLQTMIEEANQNIANLEQVKANKSDLNAALIRINDAEEKLKLLGSKVDATAKQIASRSQRDPASPAASGQAISSDIVNDLGDLRVLVSTHSTMIDNLFADKASRDTVVRQGQEIQELKLFLDQKRWGAGGGGAGGGGNTFLGLNRNDADLSPITNLLQDHDQAIKKLQSGKADKEALHQITEKLKGWIEDLQLNKADAAIVAGKAERDYVENALEKLRREVEAVMNNTNSGLIDTLDKSLNILRDMIDGKANLADMLKLREALMSENKKDEVPDGLAGYKHYRCLSCNRKMDAMRPRPMGMNFMNFMSHLPAPRTKFYQKNTVPPLLPSTINSNRALPSTASPGMIADHDSSGGQLPPIPAPAIAAPITDQPHPEIAAEEVYASDNE